MMPRRQDLMMRLKHYLGGLQSGRHDSPSSPKEGLVAHGFPLHTSRLFFLSLANAHQASGSDRIQEVDLTLLLTSREHRMEPIPPYHTVGASERPAHRTAAERLSSRGAGGAGFCLPCTIWVDYGKGFEQISQRTKGCSCNILTTEKCTSWVLPLRLHDCSPLPPLLKHGAYGGKRVAAHGQRSPVPAQRPSLQPRDLEHTAFVF